MTDFSKRFKQLRLEKGLTQEELRAEFNKKYHRNYTATAISYYENNKRMPEIDALQDFASYFGVSVSYLLGEIDTRTFNSDAAPRELAVPKELEGFAVAFHRGEFEDLTQSEVDALAVVATTLKSQRKGG